MKVVALRNVAVLFIMVVMGFRHHSMTTLSSCGSLTNENLSAKNEQETKEEEDDKSNSLFEGLDLSTTSGMWDRKSVVGASQVHTSPEGDCVWASFRPQKTPPSTVLSAPMCLYPSGLDRHVSRSIAKQGNWPDCAQLVDLFHQQQIQQKVGNGSTNNVFVEIGVNIGACMMEMLHSTNATIVGFEPDARNLFRLTSTLLRLDADMRKRVALFPIALGANESKGVIYQTNVNRGNSIVNQAFRTEGNLLPPEPIHINTLDNIFGPRMQQKIAVVKIDTQGKFICCVERVFYISHSLSLSHLSLNSATTMTRSRL